MARYLVMDRVNGPRFIFTKPETGQMMAKTKKRNPQDATLRNIRALKKRVKVLEEEQAAHTYALSHLLRVVKTKARTK